LLSNQFRPEVNMVKRRIEELLEREYIQRVEKDGVPVDPTTYQYLA
jgi:cullin 3